MRRADPLDIAGVFQHGLLWVISKSAVAPTSSPPGQELLQVMQSLQRHSGRSDQSRNSSCVTFSGSHQDRGSNTSDTLALSAAGLTRCFLALAKSASKSKWVIAVSGLK
jgi:hypothetical protein